jgi:PqqD family protein of HPr-rel-A system
MPYGNLLLKSWGDEAVVFDAASGDTHYLKPLTFALYQTCREHPGFTAAQLATTLAQRLNVADTPQFHELADEVFAQLHQIGLLQSP